MKKVYLLLWLLGMFVPTAFASTVPVTVPVPNIAAMQALGPASALYPAVAVMDFTTNGGGGIFNWNPSNVDAPDGCTIFTATGVSTGRWIRKWTPPEGIFLSQCDTLSDADIFATTKSVPLYIDKNVTVAANTTLTSQIVFAGGVMTPASGQTVTFSKSPKGLLLPAFNTASGGSFALASGVRWSENHLLWWVGADPTGVSNSYAALQNFFNSMGAFCGTGIVDPGKYLQSSSSILGWQSTTCLGGTAQQANIAISAYGATINVTTATVAYQQTNFSNYFGAVVSGLRIDTSNHTGTTLVSGINFHHAPNGVCVDCYVLFDGAHTAANFAAFRIDSSDSSATTGSYWTRLVRPNGANTNGAVRGHICIDVDDDSNGSTVDQAQCEGTNYCYSVSNFSSTDLMPNNIGINNSSCQDYSVGVLVGFPAGITIFNCGLRLWNDRFEEDSVSTTLIQVAGSATTPAASCFNRPPIVADGLTMIGAGVTNFSGLPSKYMVMLDGVPYIGGNPAFWNISLGSQYNLPSGTASQIPFDTAAANPGTYCDITSASKGSCTPPAGLYSMTCNASIGMTTGPSAVSVLGSVQGTKNGSNAGSPGGTRAQVASLASFGLNTTATTAVSLNGSDAVSCYGESDGTSPKVNASAQFSSMQLTLLHLQE